MNTWKPDCQVLLVGIAEPLVIVLGCGYFHVGPLRMNQKSPSDLCHEKNVLAPKTFQLQSLSLLFFGQPAKMKLPGRVPMNPHRVALFTSIRSNFSGEGAFEKWHQVIAFAHWKSAFLAARTFFQLKAAAKIQNVRRSRKLGDNNFKLKSFFFNETG